MKTKVVVVIITCIAVLTGCTNSSKKEDAVSIYKDLDAKETYEKLVEKMNSEVEYVVFDRSSKDAYYKDELYKIDGSISVVSESQMEEDDEIKMNYSIRSNKKQYVLNKRDGGKKYDLDILDDEINTMYVFFSIYDGEETEVLEIERSDQDEKIVLDMKFIQGEGELYILGSLTIGKDGFLESQSYKYYITDTFTGDAILNEKIKTFDYNQKTSSDFDKEIKLIKSLDGATEKEIKEKAGFEN